METLAPALPLLSVLTEWNGVVETAAAIAVFFTLLSFLFRILLPAFPLRLAPFAFVLTAAAVFCVAPWPGEFRAHAALSLCMLWLPFSEKKEKFDFRRLALKALGFFALLLYLAAAQEFLGRHLQWPLFQRLPGTFLLLLIPALMWPASRRQKGPRRPRKIPVSGVPV